MKYRRWIISNQVFRDCMGIPDSTTILMIREASRTRGGPGLDVLIDDEQFSDVAEGSNPPKVVAVRIGDGKISWDDAE